MKRAFQVTFGLTFGIVFVWLVVSKFAYSRILIGACVMFDKPINVYVQESSVWRGRLCVRPVGQTECYWAPSKNVSKL